MGIVPFFMTRQYDMNFAWYTVIGITIFNNCFSNMFIPNIVYYVQTTSLKYFSIILAELFANTQQDFNE